MTSLAAQLTTLPQSKQQAFVNSLSNQDAYVLLVALEAEECRASLKTFMKAVWPIIEPTPFIDGLPIDAMIVHLEALTRGDIKRLVINIPPRHTKSTLLVIWRVWVWLQNPYERILSASYSLNLSIRDNLRCRRIIEDPWFQARFGNDFKLTGDQNAKSHFDNDQQGYQMALSVAGGTTGHGGSILVIDDLHNADEAHSEKDRETALNWFREVWTNRLNDQLNDRMLLVGQRIHAADVCGYVLSERPDWISLILSAFYESARHCTTPIWSDPRKEEGELLWPMRFSKETLDGLRRDLGSIGFAAQYQQLPVPAGGSQFKQQWFRYYLDNGDHYELEQTDGVKRVLATQCHKVITVDLAISQKQSADYTVICVWAITPDREIALLDCLREHLDNPDQQKQIQLLYHRYHPDYILVENVAYQLAIIQQLLRLGLPAKEYKPVKDKVSRSSTAAVLYEAGRMYHPRTASWLAAWEDELLVFPMGAHDDQVDNASMICDAVSGPSASASEQVEAMKRRVSLAQSRSAHTVPAGGVVGWQR